jgi:hypothetical protein
LDTRSGDIWISFDGGWDGARTIQALFDPSLGSATMTLYNNALQPVAVSSPFAGGAQLTYVGTSGAPYFMRISGNNPHVTLQALDTLSIGNVTRSEGSGGTTDFVFTATISAAQSQAVTVNYATVDGTATAAAGDYTATSGTLSFAPGETVKLITVSVNADSLNEPDELFSVVLSSPSNIALGIPVGLATITNDDGIAFNGSLLFASNSGNGGGGSAAPAAAAPQTQSASPAAVQSSSPPASEPLAAVPTAASSEDATDAALEEDEDWVTELALV